MTSSGSTLQQYCSLVLLLVAIAGVARESHAQAESETGALAATAAANENEATAVDRGSLRLQLLMSLVENELRAAIVSKTQLTDERRTLNTERKKLAALGPQIRASDRVRLEEIERRLVQLNEELAAVDARLPEITSELDSLQRGLNGANGTDPATAGGEVQQAASQWLDSNRRIQEALVYLGGYNALIDGDLGPRTREAVKAYQERQAYEPTGILTDEQQTGLLAEADAWRVLYGMKSLVDTESGYRLTYPSSLLAEVEAAEPGTRRMATSDGESELLITALNGSSDIPSLYASLLEDYEVQYRRKRNDWYVVAGVVDDERIFYDMARQTADGVVRARLTYPADRRDLWSPFAVMMFNTFETTPQGDS